MKDRIQQLRSQAHVTATTVEDETVLLTLLEEGENADTHGYFDTIDDLRRSITVIGQKLEQIRANHHTLLTRPRNDALQAETDQILQQIKVQALKVNNTIKRLGEEITAFETSADRTNTDVRIRRAQYNTLVREFRDTMYKYNTITEEYRAKSKDRIKRHMSLVNKDVTEEQLEDILDNPSSQDVLVDTAQWQQALGEIQARNQELKKLQTTLQDLYEMFLTMATLVEEQGETVDRIEDQISAAADHVGRGAKTVRETVSIAHRGRKLKMAIACVIFSAILCVVIFLIIVVAVVVIQLQPR